MKKSSRIISIVIILLLMLFFLSIYQKKTYNSLGFEDGVVMYTPYSFFEEMYLNSQK
ncbi:MAG: hypothetical protein NUW02_03525 [Candidatus Campbellbacteria bacterium]|nr:hypothetical protein [Candidatus Campbellbacteria bacterium]